MKISGKNPYVNMDAYIKNIKNNKKIGRSTRKGTQEVTKEDQVVLSPRAKEIQEAKKLLNTMPDIREEKVSQIREQIHNGTYEINGEKIAMKMLRETLVNQFLAEKSPEEE